MAAGESFREGSLWPEKRASGFGSASKRLRTKKEAATALNGLKSPNEGHLIMGRGITGTVCSSQARLLNLGRAVGHRRVYLRTAERGTRPLFGRWYFRR